MQKPQCGQVQPLSTFETGRSTFELSRERRMDMEGPE
jgi:hypothetical protein